MSRDIHNQPPAAQFLATIYFGRNCPDGSFVTAGLFAEFLGESVTPHYPGFTLMSGEGYWKGKPELVTVLTVLLEDDSNARHGIRSIAEQYKTRFVQDAVAYSFTPCQFALNCWPYGPVSTYHRDGKGY